MFDWLCRDGSLLNVRSSGHRLVLIHDLLSLCYMKVNIENRHSGRVRLLRQSGCSD